MRAWLSRAITPRKREPRMWWKKYEPILEAKPVEGVEAIRDLIAKEIVEVLEAFPPAESDVEWEDAALARRLRGRLADLPRVDADIAAVVFRIVAWDLAHEIDAIDHLMRNDPPQHRDAVELLWRGIVEHLYARKEDCGGLLKGKDLALIVEKARARYVRTLAQ